MGSTAIPEPDLPVPNEFDLLEALALTDAQIEIPVEPRHLVAMRLALNIANAECEAATGLVRALIGTETK